MCCWCFFALPGEGRTSKSMVLLWEYWCFRKVTLSVQRLIFIGFWTILGLIFDHIGIGHRDLHYSSSRHDISATISTFCIIFCSNIIIIVRRTYFIYGKTSSGGSERPELARTFSVVSELFLLPDIGRIRPWYWWLRHAQRISAVFFALLKER